jgi:hypothetical protein
LQGGYDFFGSFRKKISGQHESWNIFFFVARSKNILIANVAGKNILILVEEKK